jgi:hypothetical protein
MTLRHEIFFLDDTAACFVAHVPVAGMKIVKLTMKPCQITASTAPSDHAYATLCSLDTCSGLLGVSHDHSDITS